jgi:hypothetical protein
VKSSGRPPLSSELSSAEFRRWYWMKHELVGFARQLGLPTSGDKPTVAERIAARLDGAALPTVQPRRTVSRRLPEPLVADTVLPARQAASQQLRAYFTTVIGPRFFYDIHMRTFLASDRTKTIADAVDHWHATRNAPKPETLPQLELVRFTKAWHLAHPSGTAAECRAAWKRHKSLPTDER